ncbi:MucB/RseB C-terminal domain-containing protein [Pusillimonas noertemannii]|uniref:MucB/RseB-like sigma(E) regulatory protein n=1 Tax=Pusillimonas noertemannii TaxID=305977 RepID=A0A2U1CS71_9BURK|nr:MucB/RseB C-terminal domain-containing protein [Pusillimonas noertemannii]NYT68075.1 MucB/RseB C-terminal domain-containing protein [Pusillimonas noertemannii]PVY68752.1 MucB/RseB-like sigma(E) regulatory protein [Pusillimonas noertemannii]TFL11790.1 siderophore-interacting protein [Pusillimonas noertemannii]
MAKQVLAFRAHRHAVREGTLSRLGVVFMLLACTMAAAAQGAQADDPLAGEVTRFLQQTQQAARNSDYSGVFTYQQGASMQSSRIVHVVDGTGERERLVILDGEPREFIRHNDTVQCLVPAKELVLIEKHRMDRFPGVLLGEGHHLDDHYTLRLGKHPQRVAGHECVPAEILPQDNLRYGYRFCVDPESKLLIKAQTIDDRGEVVNQIAFTSLQQGSEVQARELQSSWDMRGWRTVELPTKAVDVAGLGWRVALPPGFVHSTQISRPMKSGKPVMQMVLTDGLAAISVFIEQFHPAQESRLMPKGAARNGAMSIYGTRIGDHWLTAIGEVPADTLRQLVEHIEYVPPGGAPQ